MIKILFNATNNIVGGGVRNSALFVYYAIESRKIDWLFLVSKEVKRILDSMNVKNERIIEFSKSPARSKVYRQKLLDLVKSEKIDLVYTMAGPIYARLPAVHVMGISNAYITHPSLEAYFLRKGILGKFNKILSSILKSYYAKKADYFVFQTEYAKNQFCNRFKVSQQKVRIIPNAFDEGLKNNVKTKTFNPNKIEVFCPSAAYEHKGLQYIPSISSELEKLLPNTSIIFKITIDSFSDYFAIIDKNIKRYNQSDKVITIGKYDYGQTENLFNKCDFVFVPSLLETFSATYLEAMIFRKPLIVSDRNFARDICRDSAVYIEPKKPKEAALTIMELIENKELRNKLVQSGTKNVLSYPSQSARYKQIENTLLEIIYIKK